MLIIIIIGLLLLIVAFYLLHSYSIEKYNFNPIFDEGNEYYGLEIGAFFLFWAGLLFQYYTRKRIGWIDINLNTFILWLFAITLILIRLVKMAISSNIIIGITFISLRIIIGIIVSVIISLLIYKIFDLEDTFFLKLVLFLYPG